MLKANGKSLELALLKTVERIDLQLIDANNVAVDATELKFTLTDLCGRILYADNFFNPPSPPGVTRIRRIGTGRYYFPMGDGNVVSTGVNETLCPGDFLGLWQAVGPVGTEELSVVQSIKVVTPTMMDLVNTLRHQIDKSAKIVTDTPDGCNCYLGYTDAMLIEFLEGGLQTINSYQPYPTFNTLDNFPRMFKQTLVESALLVGVSTQSLFALDTDIPSYSAQGSAFVIQHFPNLLQYFTTISQRCDKIIPQMKLHLCRSGSIHTELMPNSRLQTLISAAPSGALFRNLFLA